MARSVQVKSWLIRYASAIAVSILLLLLKMLFSSLHEHGRYFLNTAVVAVFSFYGGIGPALLIILISVLASAYFIFSPLGAPEVHEWDSMVVLILFGLVSVLIAYLGDKLKKSLELIGQAKVQAEKAAEDRTNLLAMISHDLKNPLSSIGLNTKLLMKTLPMEKEKSAAARKKIALIDRALSRVISLVEDILDMDKIESGHLAVEKSDQNVVSVISEIAEIMKPLALEKSISFRWDPPPNEIIIKCDRHRLLQVLSNLIGNALKFTAEGGRIGVVLRREASGVMIEVSDTGPGIRAEHIPHLFERYWQVEQATRQGSGLGLFITKGLIEAHGGRIEVESQLGVGTKFRFFLPD